MVISKLLSLSMLTVLLMLDVAQASGPPPMAGLGGQKCGAWTGNNASTASSEIGLLYRQWVLGFLSGVVFADPDQWPDGVVAAAVTSSIDDFCSKNPASTIAEAAVAFVRKHRQ